MRNSPMIALAVVAATLASPATHAEPANAYSFVCPEALPSDEARATALAQFVRWFADRHSDATVGAMLAARYALLESHACKQTLDNIRTNSELHPVHTDHAQR